MDNRDYTEVKIEALPPSDYKGEMRIWVLALRELDLWDGFKPAHHGDLMIPYSRWKEVLDLAERKDFIISKKLK